MAKNVAETKFNELKKSSKLTTKIKSLFSKVFGKKKDFAMLGEAVTPEEVERKKLAKLGYSSVQAMNADDKEAEMFKFLQGNVNDDLAVYSYNEGCNEQREIGGQDIEEI